MNKFYESLHIALSNLKANATRSFLSILGIVIGIGSLVTILSLSKGTRANIVDSVNSLGVNVYIVMPHYDRTTRRIGPLELLDVDRIQKLPFVLTAFPRLNMNKSIRSRVKEARMTVKGIYRTYVEARQLKLISGRNINPLESENRSQVGILNEAGAMELFGNMQAVGKTIYFENISVEIIGIYSRPGEGGNAKFMSQPELLIPLSTLLRTKNDTTIESLEIHVDPKYKGNAADEITKIMEKNDPNRLGLYRVWNQQDYLEKKLEIDRIFSTFITIVGSISLLVGGIGMMNVMLTSVVERTKEIGIRRAVGAKKKDILTQFLIESSLLSVMGGVTGLMLGVASAKAIPHIFKELFKAEPIFSFSLAVMAIGSAVVLGMAFGLYPAVKASKIMTADALRSE